MSKGNNNQGKMVTLTTPSGTYKVRLPKNWSGAKAIQVGGELKQNDYVLTADAYFIRLGKTLLHFGSRKIRDKTSEGSGNLFGYYFRNSKSFRHE